MHYFSALRRNGAESVRQGVGAEVTACFETTLTSVQRNQDPSAGGFVTLSSRTRRHSIGPTPVQGLRSATTP